MSSFLDKLFSGYSLIRDAFGVFPKRSVLQFGTGLVVADDPGGGTTLVTGVPGPSAATVPTEVVFDYRGGTGNVFSDWGALVAAVGTYAGPLLIRAYNAAIPAGAWTFASSGLSIVTLGGSFATDFDFALGASITARFVYLNGLNIQNDGAEAAPNMVSLCDDTVMDGVNITPNSTVRLFDTSNQASATVFLNRQSRVFGSTGGIGVGNANAIQFFLDGFSRLEADSIAAPTQAQVTITIVDPASTVNPTQSGILDTPFAPPPALQALAAGVGYDDGINPSLGINLQIVLDTAKPMLVRRATRLIVLSDLQAGALDTSISFDVAGALPDGAQVIGAEFAVDTPLAAPGLLMATGTMEGGVDAAGSLATGDLTVVGHSGNNGTNPYNSRGGDIVNMSVTLVGASLGALTAGEITAAILYTTSGA